MLDKGLWVDVRVLAGATATDARGLQIFRPTVLDDLDGLDPAFDGWLEEQRQRLTQLALSVAEEVLAAESETKARITAAEQLLTIDRLHEGAWQALIRANLEQGNRAAARLAFERCSTSLAHAGLVPLRETEALLRDTRPVRMVAKPRAAGRVIRLRVMQPRTLDGGGMDGPLPGLAEEITAAISRFRWISCVVEAPSAKRIDPAWQEFPEDYLLDCTLQCFGKRMRVIVRVLDLQAGSDVVWARRFDREINDPLMLQGEIAAETAAQIDPELLLREGERRISSEPGDLTAFDLTLRAIPAIYRLEHAGFHAAGKLLAAAAATDPANAAAHA
jgi:hypothetical protein